MNSYNIRKIYSVFILILFSINTIAGGNKSSLKVGLKNYPYRIYKSKMNKLDEFPNPILTVQVGGMWLNNNARLKVNSDRLGVGTTIDLKKDLGINPGAFAPLVELRFRLGKRHQIVANAVGYSRHKSKTLERDIQFEDSTFRAFASVDVKTHFIAYNLDYRFSILRSSRCELGLSIGAKLYDVYGSIQAEANQTQVGYSQRKRVFAPALLPGIHGSYYITPKLLVRGKVEYFRITVSEWEFKVLEFKPSIEYYITDNFGLGGAYSYFNISAGRSHSDIFDGELKYIINGASLFASVRF